MKIPIEKKRLFKILEDLNRRHPNSDSWTYAYVFKDDEAVQVLADMGFVKLTAGYRKKSWSIAEDGIEVHLKNEFLTQVGLALFREHK